MDYRRIGLLAVSLLAGGLTLWVAGEYRRVTEVQNAESTSSRAVELVKRAMTALDEDLKLAEAALARRDTVGAAQLWQSAEAAFEETYNRHGWMEVERGITARDWYEVRQAQFAKAQEEAAQRLLARLALGEDSVDDWDLLFSQFHPLYSARLRSALTAEIRQAEEARAALAGRWMRVDVSGPSPYADAVRERLVAMWAPENGHTLISSQPMGNLEASQTWKTLYAQVKLLSEGEQPTVTSETPSGIEVRFTMRGSGVEPVKSNWDELTLIEAKENVAEELDLLRMLEEQLSAGIPRFQIDERD